MGQPPLPASEENLFSRIALSLSGGGFRASAYSLGTFKALYLLGLLENVHMLSTASGGTITGAYYAMRRKQGDAFEAIYHDFYALLAEDAMLPHALARWQEAVGAHGTHYKLIQAFADTYSEELYGEARLGLFWEPDAVAHAPFHLQSIIFGATEMYTGLTFRFQHGAYLPPPKGKARESYAIGNGNVSIPTEYAGRYCGRFFLLSGRLRAAGAPRRLLSRRGPSRYAHQRQQAHLRQGSLAGRRHL
jgi:hypothetical protein